ncbi:MAG: flavodoxin [Candidatus Heteroscillospira sp.]|jgi:flavodoxin
MKSLKKLWVAVLAVCMVLSLQTAAFAAVGDTGFSDVAADAWYAEAVEYVRDNGLMSGTSATTFEPQTTTSRAMLATILYRASGSLSGAASANFTDVASDAYYYDAVNWAAANGIVSGYGDGRFGSNDPVTREQIATILWRYTGSPAADAGQDFADESTIASYAAGAVDWAQANGIVNGMEGNRFAPRGNATRAQVATLLRNYMTTETPDTPTENGKTLVVYFSIPETTDPNNMTEEEANSTVVINGEVLGNTQYMAYVIRDTLGADIFRIEPETPYPTDHEILVDLALEEQNDNARPAIKDSVEDMEQYDTIFIGYPIWWSDMPMILYSFFDEYDFSGKTIVPFGTHGGSSFAGTPRTIAELEPDAEILDGMTISRDRIQDAGQDIVGWVNGLELQ